MIDIAVIRQHARQNYKFGGWDVLEYWKDQDILAFCEKFNIDDNSQAIEALGNGLSIYDMNG
jgi:hypothetical protein